MLNIADALETTGEKVHLLGDSLGHLRPEVEKCQHDLELAQNASSHLHQGVTILDGLLHAIDESGKRVETESKAAVDGFAKLEATLHEQASGFQTSVQTLEQTLTQTGADMKDKVDAISHEVETRATEVQHLSAQWEAFKQHGSERVDHLETTLTTLETNFDHLTKESETHRQSVDQALQQFQATIETHLHEVSTAFNNLMQAGQNHAHQLVSDVHQLGTQSGQLVEHEFLNTVLTALLHAGQALLDAMGHTPAQIHDHVQPFADAVHKVAEIVHKIQAVVEFLRSSLDLAAAGLN